MTLAEIAEANSAKDEDHQARRRPQARCSSCVRVPLRVIRTAQHGLGVLLAKNGDLQGNVEALKWYRKAADQCMARAEFNLGRGVPLRLGNTAGLRRGRQSGIGGPPTRRARSAVQPRPHVPCRPRRAARRRDREMVSQICSIWAIPMPSTASAKSTISAQACRKISSRPCSGFGRPQPKAGLKPNSALASCTLRAKVCTGPCPRSAVVSLRPPERVLPCPIRPRSDVLRW